MGDVWSLFFLIEEKLKGKEDEQEGADMTAPGCVAAAGALFSLSKFLIA